MFGRADRPVVYLTCSHNESTSSEVLVSNRVVCFEDLKGCPCFKQVQSDLIIALVGILRIFLDDPFLPAEGLTMAEMNEWPCDACTVSRRTYRDLFCDCPRFLAMPMLVL